MRYLLDTHALMWALLGDERIGEEVQKILLDKNNQIFYSTASIWEVEIKHLKFSYFKLTGKQLAFLSDQAYFEHLKIELKHIEKISELSFNSDSIVHNDPFDKMLLAQALSENMVLISHDQKFKFYSNVKTIIL